jgi:hypothetical protein
MYKYQPEQESLTPYASHCLALKYLYISISIFQAFVAFETADIVSQEFSSGFEDMKG